jgi:hypothetical protein
MDVAEIVIESLRSRVGETRRLALETLHRVNVGRFLRVTDASPLFANRWVRSGVLTFDCKGIASIK